MNAESLTRQDQISQIRKRTKLLLEVLLGIDRALDDSRRHDRFRAHLLNARIAIGETNQQLHSMDEDELAEWSQTVERMIEKIRTWLNQSPDRTPDSLPEASAL